ncbi:unnamed protein product [Didymodactylos carnosus]|uniref:Hint domain-containing protein n=1 Tax=Didymodactylos carnosus TaxID=1234261 RepID=A0A814M3C4_9BILA|nr:unnamed protein product [Didymodactylos carnosus]CAF1170383.1 unnamed protein product [Didymodactylos carnosus]CAF3839453.1 unnamed protein product [Didymodactylos carnosus]CAF3981683.1 unnamed protein product [Didymodactylos carnosus]
MCVDGSGNVYVTGSSNNRVQRWAPGATFGTTVAGGNGVGLGANQLRGATTVSVDSSNNLWVCDASNNRVMKYAAGSTSGTVVAGLNGTYGNATNQLYFPYATYLDSNQNLYVADDGNARVLKFLPGNSNGIIVGGGYPYNHSGATGWYGLTVDDQGYSYTVGAYMRVERWAPNGTLDQIAIDYNYSNPYAGLVSPKAVILDSQGNLVVADSWGILKFDIECGTNLTATATLSSPTTSMRRASSSSSLGNNSSTTATLASSSSSTAPATTASSSDQNNSSKGCFSVDSAVKMFDGTYKEIAKLQPGDRVAAPMDSSDDGTDIVLMLDSESNKQVPFYTIEAECDKKLSLTSNHLLPIRSSDSMIYKLAKDIKVGDFVYNEQLIPTEVRNITIEIKTGYYAPMSESGM